MAHLNFLTTVPRLYQHLTEEYSKETNNFIQNNKKLIDSALADMAVKNDIAVQALTKKIKYAYLLTGGSLGLALIELVVIFLKVM